MESDRNRFFGRERILFEITRGLLAPQPQSFSLVGPKLIGKSQFLHYLASEEGPLMGDAFARQRPAAFANGAQVVVVWVDCDWQDARADLIGWVYRQVQQQVRAAGVSLDWQTIDAEVAASRRIWRVARALREQEIRLVLLMDNFDRVFEEQWLRRDTVDELRPLTLEMALVVATEQPLHDLDRDLAASPLFNVMTQLFLGLLDPPAARSWVLSYATEFPGVESLVDELSELTGMHPFLLRRLGDILLEVREMIVGGATLSAAHLPLLRLRLAEHGRLVFETNYRRLQRPPARIRSESIDKLIRILVSGSLPIASVQMEDSAALNWLINQAMVICCVRGQTSGYELFTPLFAEYLARRLQTVPVVPPQPQSAALPDELLDQFSKTEAALLRYFKTHPNEVISTEQLLADVWKRPDASNRRVQEAIRRLRLQLEEMQPPIGAIENDRGRGYRFVPANSHG
ncbi:MAG: helix-turn-helix domain-containing protein [Caldilinea sp.]